MSTLTIAICAYNAEKRLPPVLDAILRQTAHPYSFDVLLIDNASADATSEVARRYSTQLKYPLRILREDRKGLTHARERAAREAESDLVAYVDDDNIISPDFVQNALDFFDAHPRAGLAGGRISATFEDPTSVPPDFDQKFSHALACRDQGGAERQLIPPADDPPPGAGLVGRRTVFRSVLLGVGCMLTDRAGNRLTSGGDTEIGLLAHRLGWELWYTPTLHLDHVMPPGRLKQPYLDKLIAGGSRAQAWLDLLRGQTAPRPRPAYALQALKHELGAAKFALLKTLRKSAPNADRLAFWRDLYHGRAAGYWQLALHDPWQHLAPRLERARASAPLADRPVPAVSAI